MTHVVHVTTAHPTFDNRIFRKECRSAAQAGFRVTLVTPHLTSGHVDDVYISALPTRSSRLTRMIAGPIDAVRRLISLDPSIVHAHDPELVLPILAFKALRPSTKIVYDAHENLPEQILGKPYIPRALRPAVARAARMLELAATTYDAIVAATPSIASRFPPEKTVLVQNYPWLRDFSTPHGYPKDDETLHLIYVGAISLGRGLTCMNGALNLLGASARLTLLGPISQDARATVTAVGDNIHYAGTRLAPEVAEAISGAHVGLCILQPLPNYLESQPTKIYEYMAAARPFIASKFSVWLDMFEQFHCGIFVDPDDPQALAKAVMELRADSTKAAEMGKRGRQAVESTFNFESQAQVLVALYRELS